MIDITKSPRLYTSLPLTVGQDIMLDGNAHHYLKNVMRVNGGDNIRLFNGLDGEFIGVIKDVAKKTIDIGIHSLLRPQTYRAYKTALIFAPLKKERNDFLIEKAVELNVTDFYPITTQNADMRKINEDRIMAQMIEAAEQCERMDIPTLHPLQTIAQFLAGWDLSTPIYAGIERMDAKPLRTQNIQGHRALLIGPAGGFDGGEITMMTSKDFILPVSLGGNILRAETAAIAGLSLLSL